MDKYLRGAASLASEAGKFSKRLTQEIVERSKEVSSPGHLYDTSEGKMKEIRVHLDSKFDKEKIDGLKRLVAMMSKGRNVKEFFPDVVKLVASNSFEVRKLVYIYLLRYAEQEPDLALLSINTFQKDLADRNPLIRAMALRVMSSIRVQVITPIIMLALKKATTDLSPYVRKAAANAIPKCYSLDPTQQEYLIEIIETLLNDNSTIVLGSVISSMNRVCPERLDLIHKHYRKLCRLLVEADEWGQITIMELLIQYARTFFLNPNGGLEKDVSKLAPPAKQAGFYEYEEEQAEVQLIEKAVLAETLAAPIDPDHELLFRSCIPLLNSRNPSVVLTVAKLFNHIGTTSQCVQPATALVRLLRCSREERYIVLLNIASMAQERPFLFKPHVRQFFIFGGEPSFVRDLKLEILGVVADTDNVAIVMREFQDYVRSSDEELVIKTIQILGRLSCRMPSIAEESLNVLMYLVSSQNENVVAEAVVVIRNLLQLTSIEQNTRIISQLSRSLDKITSPQARASILWLIGQYCTSVPKLAPDTLRKSAKHFPAEAEIVKLQILTLAAKLVCVDEREVCRALLRYVLELARYDASWDVRDRARFLKFLVLGANDGPRPVGDQDACEHGSSVLQSKLHKILLGVKATPVPESPYAGRNRYNLGTLSHTLNSALPYYKSLPPWPTSVPPEAAALRDVEEIGERWNRDRVVAAPVTIISGKEKTKKRVVTLEQFYEESASESEEEEEEVEESEEEADEDDDDDDEASEEESDEEEDTEDSEDENEHAEGSTALIQNRT
ncbi:adaptin N terminal region-domain-containing protein [Powellomyces hirtus]|nr:adaptin N terminal region-domain-containing protein [Powellomyces hirtus]